MNFNFKGRLGFLILAGLLFFPGGLFANITEQTFYFNAELRPGVTVMGALTVFQKHGPGINSGPGDDGLLFIHGMSHTGDTFRPWIQEVFDTPALTGSLNRLIYLDFPGRGKSGLPSANSGLTLGDLNLEDYRVFLQAALLRLRNTAGGVPKIIAAHSMGALVLQSMQEQLLFNGRNLQQSFGVERVLLLAPTMPREVPWNIADSGIALPLVAPYVNTDASLGPVLDLAGPVWVAFFFAGADGIVVSGAPSTQQVLDAGYSAKESLSAVAQMVGTADVQRLSVRQGAFSPANGTHLHMVSYSKDDIFFITPSEHQALYLHLTGDVTYTDFHFVIGPHNVHDTYICSPEDLTPILTHFISE